MDNKELFKILDILIDEIKTPFYQKKARKILVKLIVDDEELKRES